MKKQFLILLIITFNISLYAQDIIIDFTASGATTSIDNVLIENINNGTSANIPGNEAFNLTTGAAGINETKKGITNKIHVFPNPTRNNSNIIFYSPKNNFVNISINDISGKIILKTKKNIVSGLNQITFTPTSKGIYFINISNDVIKQSAKIISLESSNRPLSIKFNNISQVFTENKNKDTYDFSFTVGDYIKLTAFYSDGSTNYTTIQTDNPSISKTYSFEFAQCKDIDDNNYEIVQIGDQIWMAKNLNVTHYPNGDEITYISDDTNWANLEDNNTDDAYSYYNNNDNNEEIYGALYTYAAATADNWEKDIEINQGVCPNGWHLPTYSDWYTLIQSVGTDAGSKLASGTWNSGSLLNNDYFNTSGFSGQAFGRRYSNYGNSANSQAYAFWWTAYEYNDTYTYARSLYYNLSETMFDKYHKSNGFYVRCIKN